MVMGDDGVKMVLHSLSVWGRRIIDNFLLELLKMSQMPLIGVLYGEEGLYMEKGEMRGILNPEASWKYLNQGGTNK